MKKNQIFLIIGIILILNIILISGQATPTCSAGCICSDDSVTCPTEQEYIDVIITSSTDTQISKISIGKTSKGEVSIRQEDTSIVSEENVKVIDSKIIMENSQGEIKEIKVLPGEVSTIVTGLNNIKIMDINEIKIVEEKGNPTYYVTGKRDARLFFIFPIKIKFKVKIDAQGEENASINYSWWKVLASEKKEETDGEEIKIGEKNEEALLENIEEERVTEIYSELSRIQGKLEKEGIWDAKVNPLFVLSKEEKQKRTGLESPTKEELEISKIILRQRKQEGVAPTSEIKDRLPDFFDWRSQHGQNYLTPIKNQANCGGCWAFGALAVLEGHINAYYNNPYLNLDFSEQDLISCFKGNGCRGANSDEIKNLFSNYLQATGVSTETCFSYSATNDNCNNKCSDWQEDVWKINSWENVDLTTDKIKRALIENGPIEVGMIVYVDLFAYSGGVYKHTTNQITGYHAVVIIGFGESDGIEYWIVKNSWGQDWGEEGYFRIEVGDSMIDSWFAYAIKEPNPPANLEKLCVDGDGDGYCAWGLEDKPLEGCPPCKDLIKDCDDSDEEFFQGCGVSQSSLGFLEMNSSPDKAEVYVKSVTENKYVLRGTTPLSLKLNTGLREIKISKLGYLDYIREINISENQIENLSVSLVKDSLYQEGWPVEVPENLYSLKNIISSDINHDGKQELIFSGVAPYWSIDSKIYVYDFQGNTFNYNEEKTNNWPVELGSSIVFVSVGNVNSDVYEEVVALPSGQGSDQNIHIINIDAKTLNKIPFNGIGKVYSNTLPILGNLDRDKELEIILAVNYDSQPDEEGNIWPGETYIFAWNADGSLVNGWPVKLNFFNKTSIFNILSAPSMGDINGDGKNEVVITSNDLKKIYAISNEGVILDGWPIEIDNVQNLITFPITLGDINNNGYMEILAYGSGTQLNNLIYAWDYKGKVLSGWPLDLKFKFGSGSLISLGDLDKNNYLEILNHFKSYFYHNKLFNSFYPYDFDYYGNIDYGSVIGDITGDGNSEILKSYGNKIYAFGGDGTLVKGWPRELGGGDKSSTRPFRFGWRWRY
ncbi:PEGA domain-containing protein [Candidatus Woesearchaeota archaeon]|jgi:C1A family cysteine protease|nr:PEGA domain-containing protein [Candidatus Woesearchaeota archaeon]